MFVGSASAKLNVVRVELAEGALLCVINNMPDLAIILEIGVGTTNLGASLTVKTSCLDDYHDDFLLFDVQTLVRQKLFQHIDSGSV